MASVTNGGLTQSAVVHRAGSAPAAFARKVKKMNRSIKRRIELLESRVGTGQDCRAVPLEETLAEFRRIEKWLAARGYATAEEALKNGEKGPPEGWRWGSLREIAKIEQHSERLLQEAWAKIHKTGPSSGNGMV
jgi:hypothetical protein